MLDIKINRQRIWRAASRYVFNIPSVSIILENTVLSRAKIKMNQTGIKLLIIATKVNDQESCVC